MKTGVLKSSRIKRLCCITVCVIATGSFFINDIIAANGIGPKYSQIRPLALYERTGAPANKVVKGYSYTPAGKQALAALLRALELPPNPETAGTIGAQLANLKEPGLNGPALDRELMHLWIDAYPTHKNERVVLGRGQFMAAMGHISDWEMNLRRALMKRMAGNEPVAISVKLLNNDAKKVRVIIDVSV